MHKRIVFFLLCFIALLAPLSAQQQTWTNPYDLFSQFFPLPQSMLNAVSNGIYYDEIDCIIDSPAELSNYEGFSLITGYGNYEYDYLGGSNMFLSPFGTNYSPPFISPGVNAGTYLLGITGEFFGYRAGTIGMFEFSQDDNLSISGDSSVYTENNSYTEDNDTDGTADYSWTSVENYTDHSDSTSVDLGAGVDLGFMGASLFGYINSYSRPLGGSYAYTYTSNAANEDTYTDPNDVVTSKTVYYGGGENGKVTNEAYGTSASWLTGIRGDLPLELAGLSMPVRADVVIGSMGQMSGSHYNPKMTTSYTATNLTGITDTTKQNTLTTIIGQAMSDAGWDASTVAGVIDSSLTAGTYDQAAFRAAATAVPSASYALDPENYKNSSFLFGLEGLIDPVIEVNDIFSVRTRGQAGYFIMTSNVNNAGMKSVTYNEAWEGGTTSSVYTYQATTVSPRTTTYNMIDFELGGICDLHNEEQTVSVASGLFYHPTFQLGSTSYSNSITTQSWSWSDESGTDPEATASTDTIGPGNTQGTRDYTVTTTYAGKGKDNTITHSFYIPTTARVSLVKDKLDLIGGYLLMHDIEIETTETPDSTTTYTLTMADSAGTVIDTATTDASSSTTTGTEKTKTSSTWYGQTSFMLRWMPTDYLTVDFYGQTIMDALDFNILGGTTAGFNPDEFIESLGISATFKIK